MEDPAERPPQAADDEGRHQQQQPNWQYEHGGRAAEQRAPVADRLELEPAQSKGEGQCLGAVPAAAREPARALETGAGGETGERRDEGQ